MPSYPDIWCFGDSITYGTWLSNPDTDSWPARLDQALGGGRVRNVGIGGIGVAYTDPNGGLYDAMPAAVRTAIMSARPNTRPRIVLLAGGINDMIRNYDVSPTRWETFYLVNWLAREGVTTFVHTLTPYLAGSYEYVELSRRRGLYNDWVRAMYGPSNQLIDVGPQLGNPYATSSLYVDALHPNAAGAKKYGDYVAAQLQARGVL